MPSFRLHLRLSSSSVANRSQRDFSKRSMVALKDGRNSLAAQPPIWKRSLDVIAGTMLLILSIPILFIAAIYIQIRSPGPVFFRQRRLGYLGKPFICLKLRTMAVDADPKEHERYLNEIISAKHGLAKRDSGSDNRIVPGADLIRNLCVDELPQLLNILRGEMSLVGPRPCLPVEAQSFKKWHYGRFDAFPGLTGLWQVSGKNERTFDEMMHLDIRYAQRITFWVDLSILARTAGVVAGQAWRPLRDHVRTKFVEPSKSAT